MKTSTESEARKITYEKMYMSNILFTSSHFMCRKLSHTGCFNITLWRWFWYKIISRLSR